MRTAQEVLPYLEGVSYPARPEELIATAQANGAPPSFLTLGLVPTAVEFHNLGEVAEQLERLQGLGGSSKVTKQSMPEARFPGIAHLGSSVNRGKSKGPEPR